MEPVVSDNPERQRFDLTLDGRHVGHSVYRRDGDVYTFTHTEVDDAYEGQGMGSRLVAGALDELRTRGAKVVAQCAFVKSYIEDHQQYADLLA